MLLSGEVSSHDVSGNVIEDEQLVVADRLEDRNPKRLLTAKGLFEDEEQHDKSSSNIAAPM